MLNHFTLEGKVVASVSVSTTENGETKSDTQTFEGTEDEVTAKIEEFKKQ